MEAGGSGGGRVHGPFEEDQPGARYRGVDGDRVQNYS